MATAARVMSDDFMKNLIEDPHASSPQTNGIVERLHKSMLIEFYRVAFRKKLYASIADLQADLSQIA